MVEDPDSNPQDPDLNPQDPDLNPQDSDPKTRMCSILLQCPKHSYYVPFPDDECVEMEEVKLRILLESES